MDVSVSTIENTKRNGLGSGHIIAFGGTREKLIGDVLGLSQRGDPSQPAYNRLTGEGYVAAKDGAYADAIAKGHSTLLLVTESTGAMSDDLVHLLRSLAYHKKVDGHRDTTIYGLGRMSVQSFFQHHMSAISSAIVLADAQTLVAESVGLTVRLTTPNTQTARTHRGGCHTRA